MSKTNSTNLPIYPSPISSLSLVDWINLSFIFCLLHALSTATQLDKKTVDQWLWPTDVADWSHLDSEQDKLSGRPEVVGCGHSVGGFVNGRPTDGNKPIPLQRMISRCACQFFYVTYAPLDPASLPSPQIVPPLACFSLVELMLLDSDFLIMLEEHYFFPDFMKC